jgi:drug/metabolite transporter (DMT)-like permease
MEPGEVLSTAAQIAVALAGFAGVVVVFRHESVHDWSVIDKFRLRLLLTNSILPLALCMIGLLLLTVKPAPAGIWRWCSGAAVVILLPFAITTSRTFRRLDPQQLRSALATGVAFTYLGLLGAGALLLQFFNIAIIDAFWPFFTGIVVHLLAAMFQFVRIILLPPEA